MSQTVAISGYLGLRESLKTKLADKAYAFSCKSRFV